MEIQHSFVPWILLFAIFSNPSLSTENESIANDKFEDLEKTFTDNKVNGTIFRILNNIVAQKVQLALSQLVSNLVYLRPSFVKYNFE